MKIKDGYILREVAGSYVVMNLGGELAFNGMITLNETGAFIWKLVDEGFEKKEIAQKITEEYEIDLKTAVSDVEAFIQKMIEADIIE